MAFRDARTEQLTLARNDLKPYAPVQLKATGSWGSNVTLSWHGRVLLHADPFHERRGDLCLPRS